MSDFAPKDFPPKNLPDYLVPGFGVHVRSPSDEEPAYLGFTTIDTRSADEAEIVGRRGPALAAQMLSVPGFLGATLFTAGSRMFTVSAWRDEDGPRRINHEPGPHRDAIGQVMRENFTLGGAHTLWKAHSLRLLTRCPQCEQISDSLRNHHLCPRCDTALPTERRYL